MRTFLVFQSVLLAKVEVYKYLSVKTDVDFKSQKVLLSLVWFFFPKVVTALAKGS